MNKAPHYAIVTTTIFIPKLLKAYVADAKKYNRDILFVVIGDKKTPPETEVFCRELQRTSGFRVEYFSPEMQESYLSRFPSLKKYLPWNCIMRRNVGMLYAYEQGCEIIATIDDDNFLAAPDYVGNHRLGGEVPMSVITSSTKWANVCRLLDEKQGRTIYHRGFPLEKRMKNENWTERRQKVTPVVNAGLWLGEPDVDAIERLYHFTDPTTATKWNRKENIALGRGTWSPFNSQNTALLRRAIPAYFLSPMPSGYFDKNGNAIPTRYDDIWGAYILKHIADHMGEAITFGAPIVRQNRNPHNYWKDFDMERHGLALSERFVKTLASISLNGKDYRSCYAELAMLFPGAMLARADLSPQERTYLEGYFEGMRIWRDTFSSL